MKKKTFQITFKSGAQITVPYSRNSAQDLLDCVGKDKQVKNDSLAFTVNMKEVVSVVYNVEDVPDAEA